jgi:hypothetical protein
MWWIQTAGYNLAGLIWLIVIAAAPLARLSVAAVSAVDHLTPIGVDHLATDV